MSTRYFVVRDDLKVIARAILRVRAPRISGKAPGMDGASVKNGVVEPVVRVTGNTQKLERSCSPSRTPVTAVTLR